MRFISKFSLVIIFGLSVPVTSYAGENAPVFSPLPAQEIISTLSAEDLYLLLNFLYTAYKASLFEQYARIYTIITFDKAWEIYTKTSTDDANIDLNTTTLLALAKNLNIILPEHRNAKKSFEHAEKYLANTASFELRAHLDIIRQEGQRLIIFMMDNNTATHIDMLNTCVTEYTSMQTWLSAVIPAFQEALDGKNLSFIDYTVFDESLYPLITYNALSRVSKHTNSFCEKTMAATLNYEHKLFLQFSYVISLLYAYYYNAVYDQLSSMQEGPFFVIFSPDGAIPSAFQTDMLPQPDITASIEL